MTPTGRPVSFRFRLVFAIFWLTVIILIAVGIITDTDLINPWLRGSLLLIEASMVGFFGLYVIIYIVRPVVKLSREAREVLEGKRDRLGDSESEELNVIATSFNQTISRLQELEKKPDLAGVQFPAGSAPDAGATLLEKIDRYSIAAVFARAPERFVDDGVIAEEALQRALGLTLAPGGAILLFRAAPPDQPNLVAAAALGEKYPYETGFCCRLEPATVAGLAAAGGMKYVAHAREAGAFAPLFTGSADEHRLLVPLLADDEVLGVMHLCLEGQPPPTDTNRSLLVALAREAAVATLFSRAYAATRAAYREKAKVLAMIWETWHPFARGHAAEVARYARVLAEELKLPAATCEAIETAALLHDIGELGISDLILHKPGTLTADERAILETHPILTVQIMNALELKKEIVPIILNHQESWDGSGYPEGTAGDRIPIGARILALADAFQAMTSDRPHRGARPSNDVLDEIKRLGGKQFDPALVEPFAKAVEKVCDEFVWKGKL